MVCATDSVDCTIAFRSPQKVTTTQGEHAVAAVPETAGASRSSDLTPGGDEQRYSGEDEAVTCEQEPPLEGRE